MSKESDPRPTFKISPKSGPYRSFQKDYYEVKLKGKCIGFISQDTSRCYEIWFHVKSPTEPQSFDNMRIKHRAESMKDAKEYIIRHWEKLKVALDIQERD